MTNERCHDLSVMIWTTNCSLWWLTFMSHSIFVQYFSLCAFLPTFCWISKLLSKTYSIRTLIHTFATFGCVENRLGGASRVADDVLLFSLIITLKHWKFGNLEMYPIDHIFQVLMGSLPMSREVCQWVGNPFHLADALLPHYYVLLIHTQTVRTLKICPNYEIQRALAEPLSSKPAESAWQTCWFS